jgi:putative glycosyltransferase (TIGR04348 family)
MLLEGYVWVSAKLPVIKLVNPRPIRLALPPISTQKHMPVHPKPRVLIVTPAAAKSNNGNWQTAWRWAEFLKGEFDVAIDQSWRGAPYDVFLALHARRSAGDIAAWAKLQGLARDVPRLGLVLTGTDLYRDIETDAAAKRSLELARTLVVLQEKGPDRLPSGLRGKTRVIFQSTTTRQTLVKTPRHLRVVMVGHLRDEKLPQTLYQAARLLKPDNGILIDHIGDPLDADLAAQARATAAACPHYRWLGGLNHETTRRHIQRAHLLVHASKMEGGAHVVMEAVCSGTPVLASKMDGNVGMLGANYAGYFEVGDAKGLVALLTKLRAEQLPTGDGTRGRLYSRLMQQCALRAPLFAPEKEKAALIALVKDLLKNTEAGKR